MTARIRVLLQPLDKRCDLIEMAAVMGRPGAPLVAVDRAEVAVLVGPFIPDVDAVFLEIGDIGVAFQEPQQFVDDGLQMQLLGRQDRKAIGQIEPHLMAEDRARAGARPVAAVRSGLHHMTQEVEILFHGSAADSFRGKIGARRRRTNR